MRGFRCYRIRYHTDMTKTSVRVSHKGFLKQIIVCLAESIAVGLEKRI